MRALCDRTQVLFDLEFTVDNLGHHAGFQCVAPVVSGCPVHHAVCEHCASHGFQVIANSTTKFSSARFGFFQC